MISKSGGSGSLLLVGRDEHLLEARPGVASLFGVFVELRRSALLPFPSLTSSLMTSGFFIAATAWGEPSLGRAMKGVSRGFFAKGHSQLGFVVHKKTTARVLVQPLPSD